MTKFKIQLLRDDIVENIDHLIYDYQSSFKILEDLNKIIKYNMSHPLALQWWSENEESINVIQELLNKYKKDTNDGIN